MKSLTNLNDLLLGWDPLEEGVVSKQLDNYIFQNTYRKVLHMGDSIYYLVYYKGLRNVD